MAGASCCQGAMLRRFNPEGIQDCPTTSASTLQRFNDLTTQPSGRAGVHGNAINNSQSETSLSILGPPNLAPLMHSFSF
jgi:hypothetical protein